MLSPKQREIREREQLILKVARELLFEQGYYGLTMGKIAKQIDCAKGTIYLHFPCKEDLILALAIQCHARRLAMFERAFKFRGRARERMLSVVVASEYYTRLHPGDLHVFHTITGPLREKTSKERRESFSEMERKAMRFIVHLIGHGVEEGDLVPPQDMNIGEVTFGFWSLADGAYRTILSGVALTEMDVARPYVNLLRYVNLLADSYDWKPLSTEWDYDATVARVKHEIFPEETQRLYAMGAIGEKSIVME